VLILADDLKSDFSYTTGLEKQLMNFKSQVNSIDCVDMCFKQSKFSETSRLSNRTVYYIPGSEYIGDQNMAVYNHALLRNKMTSKLQDSVVDSKVNTKFVFEDASIMDMINENVKAGLNNTDMHPGMELKGVD